MPSCSAPRSPPYLEVLLASVEIASAERRQRVRHGQQLLHRLQLAATLMGLVVDVWLVTLLLQNGLGEQDELLEPRLPVGLARCLLAQLLIDELNNAIVILERGGRNGDATGVSRRGHDKTGKRCILKLAYVRHVVEIDGVKNVAVV